MLKREIIAIGATGAVFIFFLILIAYAAYGIVICFAEESTITNFKNFAISNTVLILMGTVFFAIGLVSLFLVFDSNGFIGCTQAMNMIGGTSDVGNLDSLDEGPGPGPVPVLMHRPRSLPSVH